MVKKSYCISFPTSVYAALELNNTLYIGGSDWDRRKIPYTKEIAKKSRGLVYMLKNTGKSFVKEKKLQFNSMVYSIIKIDRKKIFVGCKSRNKSLNIIDLEGKTIKQKNSFCGGIYNSFFNQKKKEILLTTRKGTIEIIDSNTLKTKNSLQLAKKGTRLWSIKVNNKNIYAGDYDGNLYVVSRNHFFKKSVIKLDTKKFYKGDERLKQNLGPSLFGIELMDNKLILGTRWGDVIILNKNLAFQKKIYLGEDVSCIEKLSKKSVLVGTRYGKLFLFDTKNMNFPKIMEIKPALQKENAIWGMTSDKKGVLVCFADGNVCRIV